VHIAQTAILKSSKYTLPTFLHYLKNSNKRLNTLSLKSVLTRKAKN